jgi:hypothetical protein
LEPLEAPVLVDLAVRSALAVPAPLADLVDLARRPLLALLVDLLDLARRPLLAHLTQLVVLVDLAPLEREVDLTEEEVLVEVHRSFSAAMVGDLPSAATPRCSPVPRSGRRANRHPCPLA